MPTSRPLRLTSILRNTALLAAAGLSCGGGVASQAGAVREPRDLPGEDLVVVLVARSGAGGPTWSPKGAKTSLTETGELLSGRLALGDDPARFFELRLARSPAALGFDRLSIDLDQDGHFGRDEEWATTPSERRGKLWSSWSVTLALEVTDPAGDAQVLPYPINLWFVADPREPDAAPVLRWSRRGWMQGQVETDAGTLHLACAERVMDGRFDRRDSWILAPEADGVASASYRGCDDHAWAGERAWRLVSLHPSGLRAVLRRFDPGLSRAAEEQARDRFAADRRAPRAPVPLAFGHDFAAAEAESRRSGRPLFVDFETTWCGPCKQMDVLVYTAEPVVTAAAAARVVAVKVDGDAARELVKRFEVRGYPTMILLDAEGGELRRAVGYQGVEAMRRFLHPESAGRR